ncbi:MAG: UbiD family decarboxylase, partial [Myxococcota bacterium]|nr:UbiD family decarboxylase [Myxococcota bacterium]
MAWDGMGAFVRALEDRGELLRVRRRVEARLEVAAIADRVMKAGGPALLFEDVSGSRFPLLINAFGSRQRMSLALGVDDLEEHARAIAELVRTRAPSTARELAQLAFKLPELAHVPPRAASRAACQEVVITGADVDLDALPILMCWPGDGGSFITLPQVITRDPESGTRNVGCYRMQRLDARSTAMHWQVHKTGARHFRRAKELGLPR